jgi:hypothetical protein
VNTGKEIWLVTQCTSTFEGMGKKSNLLGTTPKFCNIIKFKTAVFIISRNVYNQSSKEKCNIPGTEGSLVIAVKLRVLSFDILMVTPVSLLKHEGRLTNCPS